jgi:hypothetical protein
MKIAITKKITGASLILSLVFLGALAAGVPARDLSPGDEAALFSLADLGPVDLSPKTVTVEVYAAPDPELADCRRALPLAWEQVQQFYRRMGVNLVQAPAAPEPGPLAPGKRLRLELLPDKLWLARSFKAFEVEPPFRLRFLQVCKNKCAFAHLPLSVIHISFKRYQDAEPDSESREPGPNRNWLANLLIHELGHLMGLYHVNEFTNDPIACGAMDASLPNFMSQDIAFKSRLGVEEFQKRFLHSYLGGGKVFQQYQQVDFDPLRYLELVKKYNGFREPLPAKAARIAQ